MGRKRRRGKSKKKRLKASLSRMERSLEKRQHWIKRIEKHKQKELEEEKKESRKKIIIPDPYRPPVRAMSKACADLECESCKATNCICDCHDLA